MPQPGFRTERRRCYHQPYRAEKCFIFTIVQLYKGNCETDSPQNAGSGPLGHPALIPFTFTAQCVGQALWPLEAMQEGNQERQADKVKASQSHESQCIYGNMSLVWEPRKRWFPVLVLPLHFRASVLLSKVLGWGSNAELLQSCQEFHLGKRLREDVGQLFARLRVPQFQS